MVALDDQARSQAQPNWQAIHAQDNQFYAAIRQMLAQGKIVTARDYRNAAAILLHGRNEKDFALAHALTVLGLELAPENVDLRRYYASSWDGLMIAKGQKQWYATQYRQTERGWEILPYENIVNDQQRRELHVSTLAEMQQKVDRLNALEKPVKQSVSQEEASVFVKKDQQTLTQLAELDPALAMLWYHLARNGVKKRLHATENVRWQVLFQHLNAEAALKLINANQALMLSGNSDPACVAQVNASIEPERVLRLEVGIDCKVLPAPELQIKPDKFYQLRLRGLNQELRGRDLELVSVRKM